MVRIRGDISSFRSSRMVRNELFKARSPFRTVMPCSIRKARIWLIVAVRRDTNLDRTRCNAWRIQLILALLRHGLQVRSKGGLGNRFGIIVIVLLTLDEWLDVNRRDDPRLKPQTSQRSADKMRAETRLHPNNASRQLLKG